MNGEFRRVILAGMCLTAVTTVITPAGSRQVRAACLHDGSGDIWLISTRRAPRMGRLDSAGKRIGYLRFQANGRCRGGGRWSPASRDRLLDDARSVPTTVFIHGSRTDRNEAINGGWYIYRKMRRDAAGRPFRLVIWSWPAERTHRRLRPDAQAKMVLSDAQAYYLAIFLRRIHPTTPVCLIGHSSGARSVTGALHLLAGGQIAGRHLPVKENMDREGVSQGDTDDVDTSPRLQIRAVLVAAALDADWLMPGRRNGLALLQVENMLITRNNRDWVLRWYPLIDGRGGPKAMGYTGPIGCRIWPNVELVNLRHQVGRSHLWDNYIQCRAIRHRLAKYTFLDTPETDMMVEGDGLPEPLPLIPPPQSD